MTASSATVRAMFIRRTQTRSTASGESYFTFRLVRSERVDSRCANAPCSTWDDTSRSRNRTGRRFAGGSTRPSPVSSHWSTMPPEAGDPGAAHRRAIARTRRRPRRRWTRHPTRGCRFARTHPSALGRRGARGLWAMDQLALRARLQELPVPASLGAAALGSVIARMARPGSERATRRWLGERSALGELLGVDFETMGAIQLYRASDALMATARPSNATCSTGRWGCLTCTPRSRSMT